MRVALDTNRYVDLCKGVGATVALLEEAEAIVLPFVVVGELRAGFALGRRGAENERTLRRFLMKDGKSNHVVIPFYRKLDAQTAKVTIFLTGLDPNGEELTYRLTARGRGESIPVPSKDKATSAFNLIAKPAGSSCAVQDSNDDKFWVGRG